MTRTERNAIYKRHAIKPYYGPLEPHIHGGYTVREVVAQARAGWPKVPVPGDPLKAAQKLADKHAEITFEEV